MPVPPVLRRVGRAAGATLLGALLAGTYVLGTAVATREPADGSGSTDRLRGPGELRFDAYCRDEHGPRAAAYRPRDLDRWACSVWRHGVWGLEAVELPDVCRWQAGPEAKLVHESGGSDAGPAPASTEARLICTL